MFYANVNVMDMQSLLRNYGLFERKFSFYKSHLRDDSSFHTLMDSIPHITTKGQYQNTEVVSQREGMEGEDNFDDDRECMDCID